MSQGRKTYAKVCRTDDKDAGYLVLENERLGHEVLTGFDEAFVVDGKRYYRTVILRNAGDQPATGLHDYWFYVEVCSNEPYRAEDAVFRSIEDGTYAFRMNEKENNDEFKKKSRDRHY